MNDTEIKYIAVFYNFPNTEQAYSSSTNKMVLTYNGLKCDWSVAGTIKYYTGRTLLRVKEDFDEIVYNEFKNSSLEYMCYDSVLCIRVYAR